MVFLIYIESSCRKMFAVVAKIALFFGRQIYYDNIEDCYDWVDHILYIFGIFIMNRKVMENNRVQFSKKTGFALYLIKFIAICT